MVSFLNSRLRSRDWNRSAYELLSEKFSNTPPSLPAPVGCPSPQGRLLVHRHQWSCCVWISACKASPAHFHVPVSPSAFPETKQPGVSKCTESSTSKFRWSNLFFLFLHVTGEVAELFLVRRFRILGLKTDVHLWNKSVSIWTVTFFFLLLGLCSPPALVIVHLSSPAPFSLFCPGGFPKDHKQHSDF